MTQIGRWLCGTPSWLSTSSLTLLMTFWILTVHFYSLLCTVHAMKGMLQYDTTQYITYAKNMMISQLSLSHRKLTQH